MRLPFQIENWGTRSVAIRRRGNNIPATVSSNSYRILFTRGDELLTPATYRGSFEQALTRNLLNTGDVPDDAVQRAYAVSMTAFACTEYKAKTVSSIPLEILNGVKGTDETPLTNTPLDYFLELAPSLLAEWSRSHDIFGRTYLRKRKNLRGNPTELRWLNPLDVYEYESRGVVTGYRWTTASGTTERLELDEVIYTQAFDARSYGNGLSKFEAAWLALNIESSLSTFAAAFFVNGAQPDGFLSFEQPLLDQEFDDAVKVWRETFKGARNAHKTAALPGGARWNPISTVPKDLAMTELKGSEREDICAVFEVDPTLVHLKDTGDPLSASSTYSAIEISHIRNVTLPFLRTVILPALNNQWALKDFGAPYRIDIDEARIPALEDARFVRADTAINLTAGKVLDYDEGRDLLGYPQRPDYLIRPPDDALALWSAGAATLNDVHQMTIGKQPLGVNGDVLQIGGQVIPRARLMEVANANADKLITPPASSSPFGTLPPNNGGGGVTVQPEPTPQLPSGGQAAEVPRADDHSLCAMLFFQANEPTLLSLQNRLKELYPGDSVQWTSPSEFHVTLFYAPEVSDIQAAQFSAALSGLEAPQDLALTIGSLHTFDNLGEHALHFRVRRNGELLDYQEQVYEAAQRVGILPSAYSAPDNYLPHITVCYLPERVPALTFSSKAQVTPSSLKLMYGDTAVLERPLIIESAVLRSEGIPLQIAADLGGNQFVRYARRILSDSLTAQGLNAEWVDEDAWRLVLAQAENWTPNALASLIRAADYQDAAKVDARLSSFIQNGRGLYAVIEAQTDALSKAAALELRGANLTASGGANAVLLATLNDDAAIEGLPPVDFPIVLTQIGVYLGDERYHVWALRSASTAELKELTNWERVVTRKGRDHAFHVETLPRMVRDFVQVALADGDELETVFSEARKLLTDIRSYSGTRADFQAEVFRLITAANADDTSRRAFAGALRSALRRYGLMAFRDGMEDGGYSPESFSPDELTIFRAWQAESSDYVTNIGEALFKQGQTPDPEFRAEMWCSKSLNDIYYTGLRIGAPASAVTWNLGSTHEHCETCLSNDGKTQSIDDWGKQGFPQDRRLDCGGWKCLCFFTNQNGDRVGAR